MKTLPVIFAESAILDLEEIRDYYREQQVPEVGERFLRELMALIEQLSMYPDRGRIVPEFNQPAIRGLIHPPFRIIYRRTTKQIAIVRAWRNERLIKIP